ncbi:Phosphopentomutase [Alkalibacterium putridalgicola]|uniref:Phosphopentomutase n=1 Tax=Alkalibacterium putridalgicola TaxID=426703 RepID=A0A1H7V2D8_9LACT|nr:phosphopentomutase [Alkalibacterium putridalgicola]GEK89687.1 phosphopentomutase [Alkalibacterium putridalgicola]SEM03005.1 Phosphopentomutase [Alkalibacterium putridalgicola]
MGKFIVIVLDSFGVGAMDDVPEVRAQDTGSNTALHIIKNKHDLKIPHLLKLGLMNAIGEEWEGFTFSKGANWGTSNLSHQGADSFLGHQEIMGTIPPIPLNEPFSASIDRVKAHLIEEGYSVRKVGEDNEPKILVVNDCVTVGDNLETDLGQVYNVSGCLDIISFEDLTEIGKAVRDVVKVSRVITFGGENVSLEDLLDARKVKHGGFAGVDAPESGVYDKGYQVVHLGYGIDPNVQIPTILDKENIDVSLIGKVADIVQTKSDRLFPGVDSQYLFDQLIKQVDEISHGFICLNIQETDLAGHGEDVDRYADRLEVSDKNIGQLLPKLSEDDILIVMADHGNDPTIGHSQHTRERVPLLIYSKGMQDKQIGNRETMSDVAATVSEYFNVGKPANGESFLTKLK